MGSFAGRDDRSLTDRELLGDVQIRPVAGAGVPSGGACSLERP